MNDFINKIYIQAQINQKNYNIPASITIAQAILESGWGTSELATKANNLFGIKWNENNGFPYYEIETKEFINSQWIIQKAKFGKFLNWGESIFYHSQFLRKDIYKKAFNFSDPELFITEIWKAGYATDPDYVSKIMRIINENNLKQYDIKEQLKMNDIMVIIDPGHGDTLDGTPEPGAVGYVDKIIIKEVDVTYKIGQALSSILTKQGIQNKLIDQELGLSERVNFGNSLNYTKKIWISIHCNAANDKNAMGYETYYISDEGSKLASQIQKSILEQIKGEYVSSLIKYLDRGIKTGSFYVLKNSDCPAILVECGFISNDYESRLMKKDIHINKIATGLVNAIKLYLGIIKTEKYRLTINLNNDNYDLFQNGKNLILESNFELKIISSNIIKI